MTQDVVNIQSVVNLLWGGGKNYRHLVVNIR